MERTNNYYWPAAPHRHAGDGFPNSGRDLLMTRRRKQQRGLLIAAGVLVALFTCWAAFLGVNKTALFLHVAMRRSSTQVNLPVVLSGQESAQQGQTLPDSPGQPAHPVRILLLGSDQREGDPGFRTDVIVLVTVDTANRTASAVSFPRDLWVEPPTLYPMKINMIQSLGAFDAMAAMFESEFGVRPDYYVQTNFTGFARLIDSIGGIDVHVHQPLSDSCDLPQAPGGTCNLEPGVQVMDGATALWYVRSRATTSDFDRLRRAQEVIQAVFERLMNMNVLLALPQAYQDMTQFVETNIGLGDITALAPVAVNLFREPDRIQHYAITEEQATPSWSWDGMWILLPDYERIGQVLEEAGAR